MNFRNWFEASLPIVKTVKQSPEGLILVFDGLPSAKLDGISPTQTPGQFAIKANGQQQLVQIDNKMGWAIYNKWRQLKGFSPTPAPAQKVLPIQQGNSLQALLHWPTPQLPPPPQGFRPEYMEMNSDAAQKRVSNDLANKGVPANQAVLIGRKVAEYVWNYSAYPYNVYKRVLSKLSDEGMDDQMALQKAKEASERAKAIHQKLMSSGYKAAA
jgi:hypothetical protein